MTSTETTPTESPATTTTAIVPTSAQSAAVNDKAARRERLAKLEAVVNRGLPAFLKVGEALRTIRDGQLYEQLAPTFEAYVQKRFGFSRPHAYRYIDAANIQAALSPIGDKLPNESVARALVPLKDDPAKLLEAWQRSKQWHRVHGGSRTPITAKVVAKEVARTLRRLPPKPSNGRTHEVRTPQNPAVAQLCELWNSTIGRGVIEQDTIDELIDLLNQLRNSIEK